MGGRKEAPHNPPPHGRIIISDLLMSKIVSIVLYISVKLGHLIVYCLGYLGVGSEGLIKWLRNLRKSIGQARGVYWKGVA